MSLEDSNDSKKTENNETPEYEKLKKNFQERQKSFENRYNESKSSEEDSDESKSNQEILNDLNETLDNESTQDPLKSTEEVLKELETSEDELNDFKYCINCGNKISKTAVKCRYCGANIDYILKLSEDDYSRSIPIRRLLPLFILTFNIYGFYWYYKILTQLKEEKNLDINPIIRTVLLLVPIVNLVMIYELFELVENCAKEVNVSSHSSILSLLALILLSPIPVLNIWPLISVQETLNAYWQKTEVGKVVNRNFTTPELIVLIIMGIIIIPPVAFIMIIIVLNIFIM